MPIQSPEPCQARPSGLLNSHLHPPTCTTRHVAPMSPPSSASSWLRKAAVTTRQCQGTMLNLLSRRTWEAASGGGCKRAGAGWWAPRRGSSYSGTHVPQLPPTSQVGHPQGLLIRQEGVAPLLLGLALACTACRGRQGTVRGRGLQCATTATQGCRHAPLPAGGLGLSLSLAATRSTKSMPPSGTSSARQGGVAAAAGGRLAGVR